jgi:hypothetical protein
MSAHAKSVMAALAAVIFAGITAWQSATADGFAWSDLIPIAVVVVGSVQTHVIPNVPELPWAKAVVAGSSAVLAGLATVVAADPSGVTVGKLITVGAGAFLVWFVPELEDDPGEVDPEPDPVVVAAPPPVPGPATAPMAVVHLVPGTASLTRQLAAVQSVLPAPGAPVVSSRADVLDGGDAFSGSTVDGGSATEPTPIGDAAAAAAAPPPSAAVPAA